SCALSSYLTVAILLILTLPALLAPAAEVIRKPPDLPLILHLRGVWLKFARNLLQTLFALVCLPYEAYICIDAIARTAARVLASHRRLLQWQTATEAELLTDVTLPGFCRSMWASPSTGVLILLLESWKAGKPGIISAAGAVGLSWLLSPVIAWWLSRPIQRRRPRLSAEDY